MTNLGVEVKAKHCRKCTWCAEYDDWAVIANTHTPVYFCTKKAPIEPDAKCPYFCEPYNEEEED